MGIEGRKEQCLIIHDEITCQDRGSERDWELGHTGDQRMQSVQCLVGLLHVSLVGHFSPMSHSPM